MVGHFAPNSTIRSGSRQRSTKPTQVATGTFNEIVLGSARKSSFAPCRAPVLPRKTVAQGCSAGPKPSPSGVQHLHSPPSRSNSGHPLALSTGSVHHTETLL